MHYDIYKYICRAKMADRARIEGYNMSGGLRESTVARL